MSNREEVFVFGTGCFWCSEELFKRIIGVTDVTSGYSGGTTDNPTYYRISEGDTNHIEVVRVAFDPDIISREILLEMFLYMHDPTSLDKQQYDEGEMYRSIIFYSTEDQKESIDALFAKVKYEKRYSRPLVTEVRQLEKFYTAETFNQDYYQKNSYQRYCQIIIDPKIESFSSKFKEYLKGKP